MPRTLRPLVLITLLCASLVRPVHAAPRCFPETNQCIDGLFQSFWDTHGGLPVFGFPITPEAPETSQDAPEQMRATQWFERNRFENFNENNPAPYNVLLGRLGDDRLRQLGRDWQTFPKAAPTAPRYFAATGHAITYEPFWQYWSTHGLEFDGRPGKAEHESLALFGYPISEPAMETNASGNTVLTQWFERARFEYHPNNPDPYKVLLGLLGNEVRGNVASPPVPPAPVPSMPVRPEEVSPAVVVQVVDGDTADVALNGQTVRLRLIGMDTPETQDPRVPVQCFGREASARAKELLAGQTVLLEADSSQDERDRFGRLLRYVWLADGRLFNYLMIAEGYAHEYTFNTPYKYQAAFKAAERLAREQGRGFWSPATCGGNTKQPADRVSPPAPTPSPSPSPRTNCDPSYPTVCIPPPPPDLDCGDIPYRRFPVQGADPHRFDGDNDGIGCES